MSIGVRKPKNVAVFISGAGSTLQALLELHHQFRISIIITNKKNILGELKAKRFGIKTYFFSKSSSYSELTILLKETQIEVLFLAGFMRLLPEDFVSQWQGKIYNIHPSLLPKFPGLGATEKSYQASHKMGVTIHQVNQEMDQGKIFLQQHSLKESALKNVSFLEARFFLRRTEQHLLREFIYRRCL